MTIVWQDSFASGGRGSPNPWSPASNGQNWTQKRGTLALAFTGSEGTMTGASATFNIMQAGVGTLGDCSLVVRMQYQNLTDIIGLVLGYQDNSNFYFADLGRTSGKVEIGRCLAGTFSTLTSANFSSSVNTFYFLRFQRIGSTLSVKVWQSGSSEPASFNTSIGDSNFGVGAYGIGGEAQHSLALSYDTFSADDTQTIVGVSMANLGPTTTIVDQNGNPLSSTLVPSPNGNFNPLLANLATGGAPTSPVNPFPVSQEVAGVQVSNSATAAAAAAGSATLPGAAGKTTYVRGFVVSSLPPAAVVSGTVTLTGVIGGTMSFEYTETVAAGGLLNVPFPGGGLAASAQNTAIVINLPAITSGAASALAIWGVQI